MKLRNKFLTKALVTSMVIASTCSASYASSGFTTIPDEIDQQYFGVR